MLKSVGGIKNPEIELDYGVVICFRGKHKGRVFYYDDDEWSKTAVCYIGHPLHFNGYNHIRRSSIRVPSIDELLTRGESKILMDSALNNHIDCDAEEVHELWSEKTLISEELFSRRYLGEFEKVLTAKNVFLCHSSADKGRVRMLHDDLKRVGVNAWLDENEIEVGDSLVDKISEGLEGSTYLIICLSIESIKSKWVKKEWHSFLARQLASKGVTILPALFEDCDIPSIISDIKYADFRESFHDGFKQIHRALSK